jgi:sialate O-acetylesterase
MLLLFGAAQADLPLVSSSLGSNMVLQSAPSSARIWGWTASSSQQVTIVLNDGIQKKSTVSAAQAPYAWSIDLDPVQASFKPYYLSIIAGNNTLQLTNVLFGNVFICGGQSNMEMALFGAFNSTEVRLYSLFVD